MLTYLNEYKNQLWKQYETGPPTTIFKIKYLAGRFSSFHWAIAAVSDTTVSKILTIAGDLAYVLHGVPGDGRVHCETMKNSKKNGEPPLETKKYSKPTISTHILR